jgi:hypothetical protein
LGSCARTSSSGCASTSRRRSRMRFARTRSTRSSPRRRSRRRALSSSRAPASS